MAEPTIVCPNCKTEIKLTESLAAPLLEASRRDFEQRLRQKDADAAAKLIEEAAKIAAEEQRKAKLAIAGDLEQKTRAVAELENTLKENNAKLRAHPAYRNRGKHDAQGAGAEIRGLSSRIDFATSS